jgi:hypothetical protein
MRFISVVLLRELRVADGAAIVALAVAGVVTTSSTPPVFAFGIAVVWFKVGILDVIAIGRRAVAANVVG